MIKIIIISDDSSYAESVKSTIASWNIPDIMVDLSTDSLLQTIQGRYDLCIYDLSGRNSLLLNYARDAQSKLGIHAMICVVPERQLAYSVELFQLGWVHVHMKERKFVEIKPFLEAIVQYQVNRDRYYSLDVNKQVIDPAVYAPYVFESPVMLEKLREALVVAKGGRPVLLCGETGVGKEIFAEIIHRNSGRKGNKKTMNAAGLNEDTAWSVLFGHKKGSFTGATENKKGLFHAADKGTLFIDEIGSLPEKVQAKLLRVVRLDSTKILFNKLGAENENEEEVDVQVIAATNELDKGGKHISSEFRADLFGRFIFIEIPALAERRDEIPSLAHYMLARENNSKNTAITINSEAVLRLLSLETKFNVRSIENYVCRAYDKVRFEGRNVIKPDDIG